MRCQAAMTRECPTSAACELQGCLQPYGPAAPGTALAVERQPIDLPVLEDYQPGRIMRGLMALTDRGERAVKRGPTPFAVLPAPQEPEPVSATAAPPPLPPAPVSSPPQPSAPANLPPPPAELKVVAIPGGWIIYAGDRPAAVASDPAGLGATVAGLVRR